MEVTSHKVRSHWFVGEQRAPMSVRRYIEYILGKPGIVQVLFIDEEIDSGDGLHKYELAWSYPTHTTTIVAAFDDANDKLVWMKKKEGMVPYTDVPELYAFAQAHEWPIYILFRECM